MQDGIKCCYENKKKFWRTKLFNYKINPENPSANFMNDINEFRIIYIYFWLAIQYWYLSH